MQAQVHLQRSCAHRLLHSFPTRRSSDLSMASARMALAMRSCSARAAGNGRPAVAEAVARDDIALVYETKMDSCGRDRKSTRLNSSHRCTSYAVFCLKKKRHTTKSLRGG